jgi:hypothetical protein
MQSRLRRNDDGPPTARAIPTLDLHGAREGQAIRAVTDFIEENRSRGNVRIITGTGSHSTNGPVLRTSVRKLLEKRQMSWESDTSGSFLVNSNTGITLYREAAVDTKVMVVEAQAVLAPIRATRCVSFGQPILATVVNDTGITIESSSAPSSERFASWADSTPAQVASADQALYNTRELSMITENAERKTREYDKQEVARALALSKKDLEHEEAEEQALLEQVLALSSAEQEQFTPLKGLTEEELLQQGLEESQRELSETEELSEQELDRALREALEKSVEDISYCDPEEERLIREAMEMSLNY